MNNRYAIYFWPEPGSALAELAARWPQALPAAWTAEARAYGLHATLKPPFRLAPGTDLAGLTAAVAQLAARLTQPPPRPLALVELDGFLALTPPHPDPVLRDLAQACVAGLDAWRAPLSEAERAKRLARPLSARQTALLEQWGYPLTEEQFRFHITLTGRLAPEESARAKDILTPLVAPVVAAGLEVPALWLVEQHPGQAFAPVARFALGAA